ncbi:MAG: toprim domain-containing protein [Lachnospiraceae bacterium]|nr:toprim domain-containing protein [Lachnospiraceae bacterium]
MDRKQAKEAVRERIEDYLTGKGINPRRAFLCLNPAHNDRNPSMSLDRRNLRVHCFSCGAKYDIFDLIGIDYGLTDSKAKFDKGYELYGIAVEEAPSKSAPVKDVSKMGDKKRDTAGQHTKTEKAEAPAPDFTKAIEAAHAALMSNPQALSHFTDRGLTKAFIEREKLGYAEKGYNSLLQAYPEHQTKSYKAHLYKYVLPFLDVDGVYRYFQTEITDRSQIDDYNRKYRKITGMTAPLYNERYLKGTAPDVIFLCEGLFDAYSIEQAGGKAIALQGSGGDTRFTNVYRQYRPETTIVFYMDTDGAGAGYEERILKNLPEIKGRYIIRHPTAGKDANEELVKNPEAFYQSVSQMIEDAQMITREAEAEKEQAEKLAREKYLSTSAGSHLQEFIDGISASVDTEAIPTGFSTLDAILDGGLYEGLYVVGAISSLGKTTLIMQIADYVAASGTDVLIMSLEMARNELMSKSISRHTLELTLQRKGDTRDAKTARGITAGRRYANYSRKELQLIQDSIKAYGEYAQHIFISEGVGDITVDTIRETVRKHILYTGGKLLIDDNGKEHIEGGRRPLLVVDYLQIIAPYNERATDKQNTDKAVIELKRISRDYKIPVIAISSFNRPGYKGTVSFESFKESGGVEYSSDVVIGLQLKGAGEADFDATKEKKRNPREIELVILKNRQAQVGDKVALTYYPQFNYFREE